MSLSKPTGYNLLYHLEQVLGGPEVFEPYMKAYFKRFAHQSIATEDWKQFLYSHFASQKAILDAVDWQGWLYTPGLPPVSMPFDTTLVKQCTAFADEWKKMRSASEEDVSPLVSADEYEALSTSQKVLFLEQFDGEPLEEWKLALMDGACKFSETKNCEVEFRWFKLCLASAQSAIIPDALAFLTQQGRMKYVRPLYRSLAAFAEGKTEAVATFKANRDSYHPICAQMVAKDLGLA